MFSLGSRPGGSGIPQTLSYQGVLTDAGGAAVADGTYAMTFRLYDTPVEGTSLWTESLSVAVTRGVFSVILGAVEPLELPFDVPYWLGITVGEGPELVPRTELMASAYSLNARTVADSAVTGDKIARGSVVRSENGLTDHVTIAEGDNISIMVKSDTLRISAPGAGAGSRPCTRVRDWQEAVRPRGDAESCRRRG